MNKIQPFFLFFLVGVILSVVFSSGQVENPDTHLRLTQTRLLLKNHHFGLPDDVGEDFHGNIAINQAGKRFMVYNPGQTLLFIPIYYLAEALSENDTESYYNCAFIISFINLLIHSLSCFLLFKIAQNIGSSIKKSYFVSFVFCFTSYSFSFAQSTYEHHFEMFFILMSFYLILTKTINYNGLFAGLVIALGIIFRSTTILAIPGILILCNMKQRMYLIIGLLPGILIIFLYNYNRFGNLFESGYDLAWHLANGNNVVFWSLQRIPQSLFGFLFSPAKGLLFFSPTLIFAFFGVKKFRLKYGKITLSIILCCIPYLFLFSMNFAWHGSIWSFGPRYILPILPLLYLPLIEIKIVKWYYPILIIAALGQVLLMSVNYKRDLLEQNIKYNGINETKYIYNIVNIPYFSQMKQLIVILPKNFSGSLVNDFPNTAWKKEIRKASSDHVLKYSIEKNSVNFWWVRVFHWKTSLLEKVLSLFLLLAVSVGALLMYRNAKKNSY